MTSPPHSSLQCQRHDIVSQTGEAKVTWARGPPDRGGGSPLLLGIPYLPPEKMAWKQKPSPTDKAEPHLQPTASENPKVKRSVPSGGYRRSCAHSQSTVTAKTLLGPPVAHISLLPAPLLQGCQPIISRDNILLLETSHPMFPQPFLTTMAE